MERFRDDNGNGLTPDERKWLTSLIVGFYSRFVRWPSDETEYLSQLYRQNWETFTLSGHAYLHVSFDLAVVIAETLREQQAHSDNPLESQARAAEIYLALEKGFRDAVRSNWDKPPLVKFLLWRPFEFDSLFLAWLIQLRNSAWIHALKLSAAPDDRHRRALKLRLHAAVLSKLEDALTQSWPWSKIFGLSAPGALAAWGSAAGATLPLGIAMSAFSLPLAIGTEILFPVLLRGLFETLAKSRLNKLIESFESPTID
jgi:hypothetical protein